MPLRPEECEVVYDGLISLCDTALVAIGHGLEEIRLACLEWRTSVESIRDAAAKAAASDEYRQYIATAQAPKIQKDARAKRRNLERQKTTFQVARQAETLRVIAAAAAAAVVPAAPIAAAPVPSSDRLITVPNFYGNIREFPHFWALVIAGIDKQPWPTMTKLSALVSKLKGEAKKVVEGIVLTEANYPIIKDMLEFRYGDEEWRIMDLRSRMTHLRPCVTYPEVNFFQLELESLCQQLEALHRNLNNEEKKRCCQIRKLLVMVGTSLVFASH